MGGGGGGEVKLKNLFQIMERQGDVLGEFSQSQSKIYFFEFFQEKNYIPGKGMNRVTDDQN